jgi:rSAM/selenodomain-associated transferase 2
MLTVIIPNLNNEAAVSQILGQLSGCDVKVILSDGGSKDNSLKIAAEHGAILACGCCGRGHQLRRGAWMARTEWLLFLHADSQLPHNWEQKLAAHITRSPHKAGYFAMKFAGRGFAPRCVEFLVGLRSFFLRMPYGDQGLLISRSHYDEIGGYAPLSLFEDVDIIRKIGRKRLTWVKCNILTDASKYERDGYFRRGWRNIKLARRFFKGESADVLCQEYNA